MQIASALAFSIAMIATFGILFRCMSWSLDSPVLRRAWRKRRLSRPARLGFVVVLAISGWILYSLGVREFSAAAVFFSTMLILFGSAAVMFCSLVLEDLREVFFELANRFGMPAVLEKWERSARGDLLETEDRPCVEQRRCTAELHEPCGASVFSHPRRPADRPRTGQHH